MSVFVLVITSPIVPLDLYNAVIINVLKERSFTWQSSRGRWSKRNNSIRFNFHLHIFVDKSRADDHSSRWPDITQRLIQRAPDRLGILLFSDEHPNSGDVFLAAMQDA